MSKTKEERIEDALTQLIDRSLPVPAGVDDAEADERFYHALDFARAVLREHDQPGLVADVNHVGDLIKRKLVRESSSPDRALQFGNLFERLLSQPVLGKKWAILQLLHKLSDNGAPDPAMAAPPAPAHAPVYTAHAPEPSPATAPAARYGSAHAGREHPQPRPRASLADSLRERHVFDQAFSSQGLHTYPRPEDSRDSYSEREQIPRAAQRPKHEPPIQEEESGYSEMRTPAQATEATLLRDLPFALQGVSSSHLPFANNHDTVLRMPSNLPPPIISLLHVLAEPSLLYRRLAQFVDSTEGGLVGQSLRSAIAAELRSYLSLVATLEGQIRRSLASMGDSPTRRSLGMAGVTLKRMVVWTRDATMGLRLLSLIVEESLGTDSAATAATAGAKKNPYQQVAGQTQAPRTGGQLISLIHSFASSHGDPFVGRFAERLLSHVTRPFYDMLRSWIYDGELSDPYGEFFVSENVDMEDDDTKGRATSVWEDKYTLVKAMIPSFITEEFAGKVFLIGKSLNFIRHGCGDSAWVESYSKESSRELHYGDTAGLEASIDQAYKTTMARLIHLMNSKFKLQAHLGALKKYLLLGQGDFIALLMESLASNLDRPANSQYRHTLTAQLEHAIRNSNAQYDDADVLRRLDARMLELSHGDIGWDVFTLEYKIDAPVDVVVTPSNSRRYLAVFNMLWRIKRVEYALSTTWRKCMTGSRGVLRTVSDKVGDDWKGAHCSLGEMTHFITQLQWYLLFEVIEKAWAELQTKCEQSNATLDDLIEAHKQYLMAITNKGLLGESIYHFRSQLHELLKIMLGYREAVDGLYAYSVTEYTKRQARGARIESRTRKGQWGITERDGDEGDEDGDEGQASKRRPRSGDVDEPLPPPLLAMGGGEGLSDGNMLTALRQRLTTLSLDFRAKVSILLGDLAYQPDQDMRFLGSVINFNNAYKAVRKSRRAATVSDKRKEAKDASSAPGASSSRKG